MRTPNWFCSHRGHGSEQKQLSIVSLISIRALYQDSHCTYKLLAIVDETNCLGTNQTDEPANGIKPTKGTDEVVHSNNNMKDEQFKRQVLRDLSILHFKMDQLAEDIAQINLKKPEVPASPSIFLRFNFPFSTEEDLQTFEDFLADKANHKQVQLELSRIGGNNTKVMVKRILDKLLRNAVMTIHLTSNAAEVEGSAKQWLVKSKERYEKESDNQLQF
ncbi:hypothetical protein JTB14_020468 [Gonioctena quinquepunctata]|nr:hypothetical protein JTB14_020468 [Gonioctena quinquepunctata]